MSALPQKAVKCPPSAVSSPWTNLLSVLRVAYFLHPFDVLAVEQFRDGDMRHRVNIAASNIPPSE